MLLEPLCQPEARAASGKLTCQLTQLPNGQRNLLPNWQLSARFVSGHEFIRAERISIRVKRENKTRASAPDAPAPFLSCRVRVAQPPSAVRICFRLQILALLAVMAILAILQTSASQLPSLSCFAGVCRGPHHAVLLSARDGVTV